MSGILKKMAAFRSKHITHIVNDVEFKFYPIRIGAILSGEMKKILSPIVEVTQSVIRGPAGDVNDRHRETTDAGHYEMDKGVSVETLGFMEKLRDKTRERALDILTSDDTRYQIGGLLANSMRDDFPGPTTPEFGGTVKEFMDSDHMDIPTFLGFLVGFLKANASVLGISGEGDLGNRIVSLLKTALEKKEAEIRETLVPDDEDGGDEPA